MYAQASESGVTEYLALTVLAVTTYLFSFLSITVIDALFRLSIIILTSSSSFTFYRDTFGLNVCFT